MCTTTPLWWMPDRAPAFQSGLYTDTDHLIYSLIYMLIDRERQRMGWLNPYARPFIPSQNQEPFETTDSTKSSPQKTELKYNQNQPTTPKIYNREKNNFEPSPTTSVLTHVHGSFGSKWIKEGRIFHKRIQHPHHEEKEPTNKGYYAILEDEEKIDNANGISYHMATDIRYQEDIIVKDMQYQDVKNDNKRINKQNKQLTEKYDIEKVTVKVMEGYLASLEDDYKHERQELQRKVTKLEHNIRNLTNSHQLIVHDLQDEIRQQSEKIREREGLIKRQNQYVNEKMNEGFRMTEICKNLEKQLKKERERNEFRRNRSRYRS